MRAEKKVIDGIIPVTTTNAVYLDGTNKTLQEAIDNGELGGITRQELDDFTGGKKQRYLTQSEYDALSDAEKNNPLYVWNITDAEEIDVNTLATKQELNSKANSNHNHDSSYALKSSEHSHSNKSVLDQITTEKVNSWNGKSNFSGSYNDLTNKPSIPTKTSQLTNDSNFATQSHVTSEINSAKNVVDKYIVEGNRNQQIKIWIGTAEEYTSLSVKNENTLYFLK